MDLHLIQIFVEVVKSGGFTKASNTLRIPKSSVSKAVSELEKQTGAKLLMRTTRSHTLTSAGQLFFDNCVGPLRAIEEARTLLVGSEGQVTGTLRITAPEDLGSFVIAPALGQLLMLYPGLSFELVYTDKVLDLVKDRIDLAIRIGSPKVSGLKMKRVGEIQLILVASPQYLKANKMISKPEDLIGHSCLSLSIESNRSVWPLKSASGHTKVRLRPKIISNQMSSLLMAAANGAGVALVPAFICKEHFDRNELVRVLPQWTSEGTPVTMLSPIPFSSSAKLRAVTDYINEQVQKALEI